VASQVAYLDWMKPGWDRRSTTTFYRYCLGTTNVAAALIVALTAVVLHRLLKAMGLSRLRLRRRWPRRLARTS
jgi:hypothetical protein